MTQQNKLPFKIIANILGGVSPITISRLAKSDKTFPEIETIGRSKFIDSDGFYKWLSAQAGFKVSAPDKAITSKHLQQMLDKSHTWLWKSCKEGLIEKPFKIGRLNFWMQSQFEELQQAA